MPDTLTPIQQEQAFIDSFSSKLEKQAEGRAAPAAPAPTAAPKRGEGEPAATRKPAASSKAEETPAADTGEGEGTRTPADDGSDAEDGEGEGEGGADTGGEPAAEPTEQPEPKAGEGEGEAENGETGEPKVGDDGLTDATREALTKHGLKLKLEDLPAEARPIVEKKLNEVNAAFTRAQMEATEYRKERRVFVAERQFFYDNPELALADVLATKPDGTPRTEAERDELETKIAAQLDKIRDPDKRKGFDSDVKDARTAAGRKVDEANTEYDRQLARADGMVVYSTRACEKLNLPYDIVSQAIALELNKKPDGQVFLTEAEMDKVIDQQARILRRHTGAKMREERKAEIRTQTKDRKTSSPAARITGSAAPAPAGEKAPKTDEEFAAHMEKKYAGAGGRR